MVRLNCTVSLAERTSSLPDKAAQTDDQMLCLCHVSIVNRSRNASSNRQTAMKNETALHKCIQTDDSSNRFDDFVGNDEE